MTKPWSQLGREPWVYEWAFMVNQEGMSEHEAKSYVITRWMKAGDFRPLLAAIKNDGLLRGKELRLLAQMLKRFGEVVVVPMIQKPTLEIYLPPIPTPTF